MEDANGYNLSELGREAAESGDLTLLFKIWGDLWHPVDNTGGYLSLGVAENNLMHKTMADYIQKNLTFSSHALTYGEGGMGSTRTRNAIARFLNRHLKPVKPIEKDHVIETNGCTTAIEHCAFLLSNPDEYFLLGQPHYGAFIPDITLRTKSKVLLVSFGDVDPVSLEAVQCYEKAILQAKSQNKTVKALMLCHPHNPLGRCYPVPALKALMTLCQTHNIHLISDEIYALSTWSNQEDTNPPPVPFTSILSIPSQDLISPHLLHILWGMSKDFAANGLRVGVIISQSNPAFIQALKLSSLYSCPSSLADIITGTILLDDTFTKSYIREMQSELSKAYSRAVRFLNKHRIEYLPGANSTFFLWVNLSKAYRERHPTASTTITTAGAGEVETNSALAEQIMTLLLKHKVFLASGRAFGGEKPGWFRIVFAQTEEVLNLGFERVIAALEDDSHDQDHSLDNGDSDISINGSLHTTNMESGDEHKTKTNAEKEEVVVNGMSERDLKLAHQHEGNLPLPGKP